MDNEMQQTNPDWYKDLQYQDVKVYIRDNINSASRSFVAIGYYLKYVRDNQLYSEDGYATIWEFAQGEFSIGKSSASSFMSINDKFSVDGNSPILLEQYRDFTSSKLAEMLTLSEEQLEQVTPVTTRAEIREMKQPVKEVKSVLHAEQEQESITIDDLDFTVRTYNCLKRAGIDTIDDLCGLTEDKVIAIRNVSRKCLDEINEKVSAIGKSLKSDITEIVSIESEYTETVINETEENRIPDPDLSCKFDLEARCLIASKESCKRSSDEGCMNCSGSWGEEDYVAAEPKQIETDLPCDTCGWDIKGCCDYDNEDMHCINGDSWKPKEADPVEIVVADIIQTDLEPIKIIQPELPLLKNNDQRKDFIDAYETWPIWIDQELTGERYYRYDFDNGESFVIRVSLCRKYLGWDKGYSKELTYGREEYFILKKDLPFVESGASKSMMIDYLKDFQKKGG